MSNPANTGTIVGRLAADPKIITHKNGTSGTVLFTVYAQDNYVTKSTGQRESVRIDLEDFVRDVNNVGVYNYMKKGTLVGISYKLANSDRVDANGNKVYGMKVVVEQGGIQLLESRTAAANREARTGGAVQDQAQDQAQAQNQGQNMPQPNIQAQAQGQTQPAQQGQAVQNQAVQNQAVQGQPAQAQAAQAQQGQFHQGDEIPF